MRKVVVSLLSLLLFISCSNTSRNSTQSDTENKKDVIEYTDIKDKSFNDLFKSVQAADLTGNVFKLVGQDYTVITSGDQSHYNSMTASYGGWGQLFENPVTWCFLRANRYTLELIREKQTYTMSYFDDQFKEQVLYFGSKTGRDGEKMKNHKLTSVGTPSGNISYKEAKLIIECKLVEVTTVSPEDFYSEKGKAFVEEAFEDAKDYHKLVFGEITNIWIRK